MLIEERLYQSTRLRQEIRTMAATYTFEDLSGGPPSSKKSVNPYADLIESCDNDPVESSFSCLVYSPDSFSV
jgi:hypothetical protein